MEVDGKYHMSWKEVEAAIHSSVRSMKNALSSRIDVIYALPRGGVIPASLLHRFFPEARFELLEPNSGVVANPHTCIICDDIWDSGKTMQRLMETCPGQIYWTLTSKDLITAADHFYGLATITKSYIVFPWEMEEGK